MPRESTVNFVVGFGAQKSGSTWLWQFLSHHPETNMGEFKEYGVWDTVLLPGSSFRQQNYKKRLTALHSIDSTGRPMELRPGDWTRRSGLASAVRMMADPSLYPAHFMSLARSHPDVRLVGDITPSYALLGTEHLTVVRSRLESAGFILKPVFVLRDPVSRMASAYRMLLRRQARGVKPSDGSEVSFTDFSQRPGNWARANYPRTIDALDTVFGEENVFFGQYETFFEPAEIARLLSFLGLSWSPPNVERRVNQSQKIKGPLTSELSGVRKRLEPIYEHCYTRFPMWDFDKWTGPDTPLTT
jgi:hypothetical protein